MKHRTPGKLRKKIKRAIERKRRRHLEKRTARWSRRLELAGGASGLIPMLGSPLLRLLAEESGLRAGISRALVRCGFVPGHDRGQVLIDTAVALGLGATSVAGAVDLLAQSQAVLQSVASSPTARPGRTRRHRPGQDREGAGSPPPQALCVYLLVVQYLPVGRVVALLESLTGAAPSAGFVHGMLARAAGLLTEVDKRIAALLTLAYVVCADETPLRVGAAGAKKYLLVACTDRYTHYLLGGRDLETFKAMVLKDLAAGSVIVHDRYQNYECATRRWCLRMGVRDRHRRAVVATRWKLEAA